MLFRVMTYNTHRAIGIDRRFRPERLVRIIGSHDADIVLLQEVDDGVPRSRGLDLARELASLAPGAPCLVGGDFNDWRSQLDSAFTELLSFRSAAERAPGGERALLTYPSFFPRGPLDRIYYRGPLRLVSARRCRLRLSRIASDHLPVVADFELP